MRNVIFNLLMSLGRRLTGKGLGLERTFLKKLYEWAYRKVAPPEVSLVRVQSHQMYVNPQDEPLGRSLATQGIYEAYETQLFRNLVQPGMTVVDIGANVGYYTLMAAELVGETGRVYAFEPEPGNYELLVRNIELNGYKNVETVQKAVSKSSGKDTLYIDRTNFGNRSLGKSNIVDDGGAVEISTITLDEFCAYEMAGRQIDVLKMDAQGAEGLILEGGKKTLAEQAPKIFMEFEPDMLRSLGTQPLALVGDFVDIGYDFRLLDYEVKGLRQIAVDRLLEECNKNGYVDLYLEKRAPDDAQY